MSHPPSDDSPPDPAAASIVARVRWLMLISGATTLVAIAAVIGVIGYRVFRSEGSIAPIDVSAAMPRGARVLSVTAANDRLVVTVDIAGVTEVRTFDLRTLQPTGRLRLAPPP